MALEPWNPLLKYWPIFLMYYDYGEPSINSLISVVRNTTAEEAYHSFALTVTISPLCKIPGGCYSIVLYVTGSAVTGSCIGQFFRFFVRIIYNFFDFFWHLSFRHLVQHQCLQQLGPELHKRHSSAESCSGIPEGAKMLLI